jgi:predicted double-glycine peptidase
MQITKTQLSKLNQQRLINKLDYLGILSEYQTLTKDLTQQIVYSQLSQRQHFLFKRVLHGLNVYTHDELEKMHWDKKRRIKRVWRRSQQVINSWKQVICNKRANEIFKIFDHSPLAKHFLMEDVNHTDDKFINKMSLKQLDITYEDLIIKFISEGLLPQNYLAVR